MVIQNNRLILFILSITLVACSSGQSNQIDLSGTWQFQIDSLSLGVSEKWFQKKLSETVQLPGSMAENGKGNEITINSRFTGEIVDSSFYTSEKYARYRKPGNVKIPFWLQPLKHYIGVAWYQKEVEIPQNWSESRIILNLERTHWETKLWVNNEYIGMQNALGTPHQYDLTKHLQAGKNKISIRVDNRIGQINPGQNSHSISDHTQTNWNGIIGDISLNAQPLLAFENIQLYPDIDAKKVTIKGKLLNQSSNSQNCRLTASVFDHEDSELEGVSFEVQVDSLKSFEFDYPMGDELKLWDEFNPNLYKMNLDVKSSLGTHTQQVSFGVRDFKVQNKQLAINGRPIFLRGTLESAIFPKTGYPATDTASWKRIFTICKDHGLNHVRFHSWCPPKAAFTAADELGIYLQVEASSWANQGATIGDGKPLDEWLYKEAEAMIEAYGNHPSFVMMAYGNEPGGENQKTFLTKFVDHFKNYDQRRVYTGGANWPYLDNNDFFNGGDARIQGWGEELESVINKYPPQTMFDFDQLNNEVPMPYVSHEIGQWCVYPNFKEIKKYDGVLRARNFEIFEESLRENHMGHLADRFLLASGKLQALCYKADIEAALRTKDFGGFQLLDIHDFPGQGTALVGVLDAFWDEKGYITPAEFRHFCSETVPLARMKKRIFSSDEIFEASVEVVHFGEKPILDASANWELTDQVGNVFAEGNFSNKNIPIGNGLQLGDISVKLSKAEKAQKLTLTTHVAGKRNQWDIWVYPSKKKPIEHVDEVRVVQKFDAQTIRYLKSGGKVLLNITKGDIAPEKGGDIGVGFSSIFWNTLWTKGQKPHTLGILCDPDHPALADFPTEYHSNWQWWDAMSHSNAIVLDDFTPDLNPIVRIIDDWFENRRTALIFEAKIGKGKLLISGIDLHTNLDDRLEAQQLLYSLKKYMSGDLFNPSVTVKSSEISSLFNK